MGVNESDYKSANKVLKLKSFEVTIKVGSLSEGNFEWNKEMIEAERFNFVGDGSITFIKNDEAFLVLAPGTWERIKLVVPEEVQNEASNN